MNDVTWENPEPKISGKSKQKGTSMPPVIYVREIINNWKIPLRENVKPLDILHSIRGLPDPDTQHVECETRNNGYRRGMDALLDDIPRRESHVFFNFLVALEQHGYEGIARKIIEYHKLGDLVELKDARETYSRPAPLARQGSVSRYRGNDSGFDSRSPPHTPPGQQGGLRRDSLHGRSPASLGPLPLESIDHSKVEDKRQHRPTSRNIDEDVRLSQETHMLDVPGPLCQEWTDKLKDRWKKLAMKKGWTRRDILKFKEGDNEAIDYIDNICEMDEGYTVGQFLEDVKDCKLEDMVIMIENALGIQQDQDLPRSDTSIPEIDGPEREYEEVFIGAPINNRNDDFNNLNEARHQTMNIRTDEHEQRKISVDENDTTRINTSSSNDDLNHEGKKHVSRRRDDSCDSNLSSLGSDVNSHGNKDDNDSSMRYKSDGRQNKYDSTHKPYTSKSLKLSFTSNYNLNENQSPKEPKGTYSPQKIEQINIKSGNIMKKESNSKAIGELVRETQEEGFEKLRKQPDNSEESEKNQADEIHEGDSVNLVLSTISSPHGSKLNPDSLLSSRSLESVDTAPKVIDESSNDPSIRQERLHVDQPMTDPDNYKRPEPLLSPQKSLVIPSLGSNLIMYGQRRTSISDPGYRRSCDRPAQAEDITANTTTDQPSTCTNEDGYADDQIQERNFDTQYMNTEQLRTDRRIVHPSSYTGDMTSRRRWNEGQNGAISGDRNIASIPMSSRDPIIDQPESCKDAHRKDDIGVSTEGHSQTHPLSTELSTEHNTQRSLICDDGNRDRVGKTVWQYQRQTVTHPSSTRLSITTRNDIIGHSESTNFTSNKHAAVEELEGQFAGLVVTHPSSTQLSPTPRQKTREQQRISSVSGGSDDIIQTTVTQPESSQHDQDSRADQYSQRKQPSLNCQVLYGGRNMNDRPSESSRDSSSLIVTHPDSYRGDSLPKGRSGSEVATCARNEDCQKQSAPRFQDMESSPRVVMELNSSTKQSEKNCETEAADLRVEQNQQINIDSYRDIQRSIPGTPARSAEQAQQNTRNNEPCDENADDTHEKEPS